MWLGHRLLHTLTLPDTEQSMFSPAHHRGKPHTALMYPKERLSWEHTQKNTELGLLPEPRLSIQRKKYHTHNWQ